MEAKRRELVPLALLWGAGIATLVILIVILAYILANGLPVISWHFLTGEPALWGQTGGGIYSTIVATLAVTARKPARGCAAQRWRSNIPERVH